jgi:Ca2+-transporting ATPase
MGASELWTGDDSLYRFTESTSLDPEKGNILVQQRSNTISPIATLTSDKRDEAAIYRNNESGSTIGVDQSPRDKETCSSSVISMTEEKEGENSMSALDTSLVENYPIHLRYALMVSSLCNNSSISYNHDNKEWKAIGDPTEVALVVASQKGKLGRDYWERGYQKIHELAFDSERKLMSVVYKKDQETILLCKGAPEEVMRKCKSYLSSDDQDIPMNDEFADKVSKESSRMACRGLRVLALAYKKPALVVADPKAAVDENGEPVIPSEYAEVGLTFISLIGLIDPPKKGVKEAVETCQEAGIRVMMITGDHVKTATAIATQLGIFHPDQPDKVLNPWYCLYHYRLLILKFHDLCLRIVLF